jgi:hypothetical protein
MPVKFPLASHPPRVCVRSLACLHVSTNPHRNKNIIIKRERELPPLSLSSRRCLLEVKSTKKITFPLRCNCFCRACGGERRADIKHNLSHFVNHHSTDQMKFSTSLFVMASSPAACCGGKCGSAYAVGWRRRWWSVGR